MNGPSVADEEIDFSNAMGGEESVRADTAALRYIYFYYVTPPTPSDHHLQVQAFVIHEKQGISNINTRIHELAVAAREGRLSPSGWAIGDIKWRKPSYLAIVLDAGTLKLENVKFEDEEKGDASYTFKNRRKLVPIGNVSGWYCINHVRKKDGSPWIHDKEDFKVLLETVPPFPHEIRGHNEAGTNTGP
jgi:hypothetical protein